MIYYDGYQVSEIGENWVVLIDGTKISGIQDTSLLTDDDGGNTIYQARLDIMRKKRNRLLDESDWTQMPDNPLDGDKVLLWKKYRQELRDLPSTVSPENIEAADWPVPPD